jgi:hypothetical protein
VEIKWKKNKVKMVKRKKWLATTWHHEDIATAISSHMAWGIQGDGHRLPALQVATPEPAVRPF